MANEDMYELQRRWRAFSADRAKAKRVIQELDDADNAEIDRLRQGIIKRNADFDEKWRTEKADLQRRRDEAVMQELAIPGRSAQGILKDLGSNNTVWIYDLRAQVMAVKPIPAPTNVNSQLHIAGEGRNQLRPIERENQVEKVQAPEPEIDLSEVKWLHHNHQGVVGWLLSEDRQLVKRYGAEKTDFEGQWFVADRETKAYIAGSRELFDATAKGEITRKTKMLEALLDETYTGRIKEVDNPYTS
jgi:hypothetical protein